MPAVAVKARHQAAETIVHSRTDDAVGQPWQLPMELCPDQGAGAGGKHPATVPFGQQQGAWQLRRGIAGGSQRRIEGTIVGRQVEAVEVAVGINQHGISLSLK